MELPAVSFGSIIFMNFEFKKDAPTFYRRSTLQLYEHNAAVDYGSVEKSGLEPLTFGHC